MAARGGIAGIPGGQFTSEGLVNPLEWGLGLCGRLVRHEDLPARRHPHTEGCTWPGRPALLDLDMVGREIVAGGFQPHGHVSGRPGGQLSGGMLCDLPG
jgi:hypothetical protein